MTTERPGWPADPDDDLDRAFGTDTASVPSRSGGQRTRRGVLVAGGVVVAAAVLAVALTTIIGSIQNGVGGVFPQPDAALSRFDAEVRSVDGVASVEDTEPVKTGFASYDVQSAVTVSPGLSADDQDRVVRALGAAAAATGGNGVRVWATAQVDTARVGVSSDETVTRQRLELARRVDAIGGVRAVRVGWGDGGPSDEPRDQRVVVVTIGRGAALEAVLAKARSAAQEVFPGSEVTSERPPS